MPLQFLLAGLKPNEVIIDGNHGLKAVVNQTQSKRTLVQLTIRIYSIVPT